jgi:diguanylate cyclase (GGDEF)-like protein/PAS domain S-box-containing protein
MNDNAGAGGGEGYSLMSIKRERFSLSSYESLLNEAYLQLAQAWSLWEEPLEVAIAHITRSVSRAMNVQRVGVWLLSDDRITLELLDLFDSTHDAHSQNVSLRCADYPAYFSALEASRVIAASDALSDDRTRQYSETYLKPLGIGAMLDATLRKAGKVVGVLCIEHVGGPRLWSEWQKRYAVSVAELVMQRLIHEDTRRNAAYYRDLSSLQQAIFDGAHYAIISTTVDGTILSFNKAASKMLGYSQHEVVGKLTPEIIHEPDEIRSRANALSEELGVTIQPGFEVFVAKTRQGLAEEREWTFIRKDGVRLPVLLSVTALRGEDGSINGFLGIASDITERKQARRALQEESARYRALFERAGDSIFLMKADRFVDCNKATLHMFGCSREQIINATPYRYSPAYQPDGRLSQDKALEKISAAFQGSTQFFEWQHLRYDGSPFDAEVTLNVLELSGEPHLLATVRDISGRKRVEAELADSRQELLARNESLRLVNELSSRLHRGFDVKTIVEQTLSALLGMSRTPHVAFYLADREKRKLSLAASHGFNGALVQIGADLPLSGSLSGVALAQGRLLASSDFEDDTRLEPKVKAALLNRGFASGVAIPLIYGEEPLGSINLVYHDRREFSELEIETLEAIGRTVSLSLANAQHMTELEYLAHHDSLTRLPNRAVLHAEFGKRLEISKDGVSGALLLLDLDRFKEINDTLGHFVGDALLKQIGPRLESVLDGRDILLCRLGGDEFTLLIGGVRDQSELADLAQLLLGALKQSFSIDNMLLELDASIGIAVYPEDGSDSHALLRSADVAMYEAKSKGCGYEFYDRSLDKHSPERLALMTELGSAIRQNQLCLHFQPKVDLRSNVITGFEALVRWQHPRQGLLYPDDFIPMAEVSELIHNMSREVIHLALQNNATWRSEGYNFTVAVNLSVRNLVDERCVGVLKEALEINGVDPGMLELEITETALMQDAEGAVKLLGRIADLGIKLSIDDFGTGYSSLAYLRRFPIHALKIDRVFVRDMLKNEQDAIIVRSTIALAHNLNLMVVAEGVEDNETLSALSLMQCDMAQGYFISKPKAWESMVPWLSSNDRWQLAR